MAEEYDNLTLFATIKTLHTQGSDLLSAISSLVLQCIDTKNSIEDIQSSFRDNYLTDIPEDSTKTILKRLKSDGLITYGSLFSNIAPTETGKEKKIQLQRSIRDLRRDFSSLVDDMRNFYASKKYSAPNNFEQELLLFIDQNIGYASKIMRGSREVTVKNPVHVAEYFAHLEQASPEKFKLLQNIFFGRVYINIIKTRDSYSKNVALSATKVYLDTNILFSILGFHDDSSTKQARELLDILKKTKKIDVLVFDETVIEARQLLQSADREMTKYNNSIPVDSIYHKLKILGHTKESIVILMENLEEKIDQEGIEIVSMPIIDEQSAGYKKLAAEIVSTASRLNREPKGTKTLRHDARVLSAVEQLRSNMSSRLFEKSQQLFVTPDITVNAVTHNIAKEEFKYPLSISVTEIVSTLWIRNFGDEKIATNIVRQSIMAYVRERAISHDLWEKFMSALEDAAHQKRLSKDDIAALMSHEDTSRILAEKQYDAPSQLVSDRHIQSIRDARQRDLEVKKIATDTVDGITARINNFSDIVATACVVFIGVLLSILLTYLLYAGISVVGLDNIANGWGTFSILLLIVVAIIFGVQIRLSHVIEVRTKLKERIKNVIVRLTRRLVGLSE